MTDKLKDAIKGIQDAAGALDDAAKDLEAHRRGTGGGGRPPPRRRSPQPGRGSSGRGGSSGPGYRERATEYTKDSFRDSRYKTRLGVDSYSQDIDALIAIDARYAQMTGKHMNDVEGSWGSAISTMSGEMRKFVMDAPQMLDRILDLPITMRAATVDMAKDKNLANQLAKTVGFFDELGISAEETMGVLDMTTIGFEASSQEAMALAVSVRDMAKELGKTPEELMQDYSQLQKTLSYSLDKINSEFRKLEIQSRATGIPVGDLADTFGSQLDTFEGSAEAAGKLNAVLGGSYLNSLELLNATESERVDMVKKAMKAAGTNLQDLQKGKGFGLKAIASSLNLPIDQTRRLLSGRSEEVMKDLQKKGIKGPSMDTAELEGSLDDLGSEVQRLHGPMNEMILQIRGMKDKAQLEPTGMADQQKAGGLLNFYLRMVEHSLKRDDARKPGDPLRDKSGMFTGLSALKDVLDDKNILPKEKIIRLNLYVKQLEAASSALERLKVPIPTVIAEPMAAKAASKKNPLQRVRPPAPGARHTAGAGPPAGPGAGTGAGTSTVINVKLPNGKVVRNIAVEFLRNL